MSHWDNNKSSGYFPHRFESPSYEDHHKIVNGARERCNYSPYYDSVYYENTYLRPGRESFVPCNGVQDAGREYAGPAYPGAPPVTPLEYTPQRRYIGPCVGGYIQEFEPTVDHWCKEDTAVTNSCENRNSSYCENRNSSLHSSTNGGQVGISGTSTPLCMMCSIVIDPGVMEYCPPYAKPGEIISHILFGLGYLDINDVEYMCTCIMVR